jgi:hypothetical protein
MVGISNQIWIWKNFGARVEKAKQGQHKWPPSIGVCRVIYAPSVKSKIRCKGLIWFSGKGWSELAIKFGRTKQQQHKVHVKINKQNK